MKAGRDRLIRELVMVQKSESRHVGLLTAVHETFEGVDNRSKKRLEKYFKYFGMGVGLPEEHFKKEGFFPTGGKESRRVMVSVFKAHQYRLYGVTDDINGIDTFIGIDMIKKKQNRADQNLLKRVAKKFGEYDA